jgi:hypothetical protein
MSKMIPKIDEDINIFHANNNKRYLKVFTKIPRILLKVSDFLDGFETVSFYLLPTILIFVNFWIFVK